jgi:preprotein translocase subunit SecF
VGSQVGEELRDQGGLALLMALFVVMLYVAFRFQFKFSVGAVFALFHDVVIILGLFSLFQWDFDLTVFAALLAVVGYSLNDTIVVADRIRENFRIVRKDDAIDIINISLNQTLGRTIMTSLTTALVLLALMFLGGELIHNFALGLFIGVIVGTYSSIYVAANILIMMNISREDLIPAELEEELDDRP